MQETNIPIVEAIPINVTIQPSQSNDSNSLHETIKTTVSSIQGVLNEFSDEVPVQEPVQEKIAPEEEAKTKINDFLNYIKSDFFKTDVNETAKEYNVSPKKLAENFFEKALGTIGDVLGIAVDTTGNIAHSLVSILSAVMDSAITVITKVANALVRIVTLNKTCIE